MFFLGDNTSYKTSHADVSSFKIIYTKCLRRESRLMVIGAKDTAQGERKKLKHMLRLLQRSVQCSTVYILVRIR
jgi:hypothetical protein